MESMAVCTLFERDYHFGVAALVNSLHRNGFKGNIYAGYRGQLPDWCNSASEGQTELGQELKIMAVSGDIQLYLIKLDTDYHLTNYKPDFMISLLEGLCRDVDSLFYLDPDIILTAPSYFLREWAEAGVAVCEDVNSPVQEYNPKRIAWREIYKKYDISLKFKNAIYANGGCLGVSKKNFDFVYLWRKVQDCMGMEIGGLNRSSFAISDQLSERDAGDFAPFGKTDQDALNVALEAYNGPISYMTKEAMGLAPGMCILPHALGHSKPWKNQLFRDWLRHGFKPRRIDVEFWNNAGAPIRVFGEKRINIVKKEIKLLAFLSRFYSIKI